MRNFMYKVAFFVFFVPVKLNSSKYLCLTKVLYGNVEKFTHAGTNSVVNTTDFVI